MILTNEPNSATISREVEWMSTQKKADWVPSFMVDIEVYDEYGPDQWAQAKYLAHGRDDVLWTDDLDEALNFLRAGLEA